MILQFLLRSLADVIRSAALSAASSDCASFTGVNFVSNFESDSVVSAESLVHNAIRPLRANTYVRDLV